MTGTGRALRPDLELIADMIAPGSRVLDVGCGDGALLDHLVNAKGIDGRGIELSQDGVNASVGHGLSVIQGDADTDLAHYPAAAFDYVVLSQTLQATSDPKGVLGQLVRIGRHAVVSFVNYGHWRVRLHLLVHGRMPVVDANGHRWYDNPNIHLCTLRDFMSLCDELGLRIERALFVDRHGRSQEFATIGRLSNLRGRQGIFLLSKG
ncbi:MAG: methionine biosynthesis protein MetW [Alphaproteobacteria bacterium]|nr:methionine biosynthesis protein MetW [Alphaproteobacteria bacterium]